MLGSYTFQDIVIIVICLVISITLHEMAHAYTALKLGDTTAAERGRISLNPLSHIDPFATVLLPAIMLIMHLPPFLAAKPVPFNPLRVKYDEFGAALIALAGPVTNLVLAFLTALVARNFVLGSLAADVVSTFIVINVVLFVFNMIPIPPLDGSRVLYAFAPEGLQRIMAQIEPMGFFVIIALVLAGFGNALVQLDQWVLQLLP